MKPGEPKSGSGDFTPLPSMTFILCKVAGGEDKPSIAPSKFENEKKPGTYDDQLTVIFDAVSYVDEDGDKIDASGSRIWFYGAPSLHEKAKLRGLALAVMPENTTLDVLTDEQAAAKDRAPNLFADFDTDMLEGKYVYVIGEANKDGYIKPTGFKRVKKQPEQAAAAPKAEAPKAEKKKAPASADLDI